MSTSGALLKADSCMSPFFGCTIFTAATFWIGLAADLTTFFFRFLEDPTCKFLAGDALPTLFLPPPWDRLFVFNATPALLLPLACSLRKILTFVTMMTTVRRICQSYNSRGTQRRTLQLLILNLTWIWLTGCRMQDEMSKFFLKIFKKKMPYSGRRQEKFQIWVNLPSNVRAGGRWPAGKSIRPVRRPDASAGRIGKKHHHSRIHSGIYAGIYEAGQFWGNGKMICYEMRIKDDLPHHIGSIRKKIWMRLWLIGALRIRKPLKVAD